MYIEDFVRITVLFPVVAFAFKKKNKPRPLRVLFFFNVFFFLHDIAYFSIKSVDYDIGAWFNLFYIPLEFLFIHSFFASILDTHLVKKISLIVLVLFISLWIISSLFIPIDSFNSVLNGTECIIVILYSFVFFYSQIQKPDSVFVYLQPSFWGVVGFFLFFSGSFFVFLYKQSSKQDENFMNQYYYIHSIFFIIRNLLFTIAILIKPDRNSLKNQFQPIYR
jgi:hypothetical protein